MRAVRSRRVSKRGASERNAKHSRIRSPPPPLLNDTSRPDRQCAQCDERRRRRDEATGTAATALTGPPPTGVLADVATGWVLRDRADAVIGTWRGRAVFRDAPLAFEVRFYRERDSLRAVFSSPDLLILDQPLDSVRHAGTHVSFTTRDEHPVHFRGILAGDTIRGGAGIPGVRARLPSFRSTP